MPPLARTAWLAAFVLAGLPLSGNAENADGPKPMLADQDRQRLEQALGQGVVGPPVTAPPVADPVSLLMPGQDTRIFRLLTGEPPGREERHRFIPREASPKEPAWQYRVGDSETLRLGQRADGSIVLSGIEDHGEGVATRYNPPKPLLIKGAATGQEFKVTMEVQVFDPMRPDRPLHKGSLDVVATYLGAYRVTVPAGRYDALLVRYTSSGHIGPAQVENTQYAFFAPGAGLVASMEEREVSAFGVYHSSEKAAKVLAAKSN
jgi:hypothetical protein